MKKLLLSLFLIGSLFLMPVCLAAQISVGTSGTLDKIELIRISIDPYGHPIEDAEKLLTERDVISKLTGKVYFSEEERLLDQLQQNYSIEEVQKDGKHYWKCTPKNPKTIQVRKSREIVQETEHATIHSTEYYYEEEANPNYLQADELEKKIVWFQVVKKGKK